MIPKMNSQQLNDILEDAKKGLDTLHSEINTAKADIQKKLEIIDYEARYTDYQMSLLEANSSSERDGVYKYTVHQAINRHFEKYGCTAHAQFVKQPINVFNLNMSGAQSYFFREDVSVSVNGLTDANYVDVLKHDSLPKNIFFDLQTQKETTIEITVQRDNLLGSTRFNMIEINPFLTGSFDIKTLEILRFNEDGEADEDNVQTVTLERVGKNRFLLDKKVSFHTIKLTISCNFSTKDQTVDSEIWPLGFKHIYFYDADLVSDSYVLFEIKAPTGKYFHSINDKVTYTTPEGKKETTLTAKDITIYVDYVPATGELATVIEPSTENVSIPIARNTNKLYAKVPLSKVETLMACQFFAETKIPVIV